MRASIVIDLGFGDSGKGISVDWLSSADQAISLVVRFGGGHQVGHTVVVGGRSHVFSNFGSGTLRGVPTWYGPQTVVFPPAIALEGGALADFGPRLFLHPLAMVATPYDIAWNRLRESLLGHGSCGVGFGATVERNAAGVRLYAKDLRFPWVFAEKLRGIGSWYCELARQSRDPAFPGLWESEAAALDMAAFMDQCGDSAAFIKLAQLSEAAAGRKHLIFEGHQGIMLDQDHGIYPHVTWSSTGSRVALELLSSDPAVRPDSIDVFYVTRCYQTRHGAGPMSSKLPVDLVKAEAESNVDNAFQGRLRTAALDPDLLVYALQTDACDLALAPALGLPSPRRSLIVTCLDQLPGFAPLELVSQLESGAALAFEAVLGSYLPDSADFRQLRS